mmetsp:Transcript_13202/g.19270  ORF Transcript_13202/g.19270 Transcript_13202/m.19270 type:complete len:671 (-) Transcript_13202:35-2047(-)
MSIRAQFDLVVHLESFRNIDLTQQGLYQLKVVCYTLQNCLKTYAIPFSYASKKSRTKNLYKVSPHKIFKGRVNETDNSLRSKVFLVRYSQERVKLNDIGSFKLDVPVDDDFVHHPIYLQVQLLYADFDSKEKHSNLIKHHSLVQPVSSRVYKVSYPARGVHEFLPVVFEKNWFSCVDGFLHVIFSDLVVPPGDPLAFGKHLFPNHVCVSFEEVHQKYSEYVSVLGSVHEGIRKATSDLLSKCFSEQRIPVPEPLRLPIEDDTHTFASSAENSEEVSQRMMREIKVVSGLIFEAFIQLRQLIMTKTYKCLKVFKQNYEVRVMERFGEFVIRDFRKKWDFGVKSEPGIKEKHKAMASSMRKSEYFQNLEPLPVQDEEFFPQASVHPVVFEEIYHTQEENYFTANTASMVLSELHLVVLVHGFQGSCNDLRMLKNYIELLYTKCVFMDSVFNENQTEGDIDEMGFRLAKEIMEYVTENCPEETPKISFIGYSLGGIIVRAALPFLECFKDKFHLFMSLSTPHLGILKPTKLIDAGMWVVKKLTRSVCLQQLCLEDASDFKESLLFKLSLAEGLEWFKYIVLVSAAQDEYAPFESARVEIPFHVPKDPNKGSLGILMADNITNKLAMKNLIKIDVNFKLNRSLDTMIGRSAHLQLLENEGFVRMIVFRYPEFFV